MDVLHIFSQSFTQLVNNISFLYYEVYLIFFISVMETMMALAFLVDRGEEENRSFIEITKPLARWQILLSLVLLSLKICFRVME